MTLSQFDYLDSLALRVAKGETDLLGPLSRGETIYVALAANAPELLTGDTIAQALARLGPEWTEALVTRWRYANNPRSGTPPR